MEILLLILAALVAHGCGTKTDVEEDMDAGTRPDRRSDATPYRRSDASPDRRSDAGPDIGPNIRPNIILVLADDHTAQAISAYGSRVNQTPNIDRLAHEGVIFHNAMVTNAICAPSRAVILTGQHCHQNGVIGNGSGPMTSAQQAATFPVLLREAGYETALIGKWHLAGTPAGFDYYNFLSSKERQGTYYSPEMTSTEGETVIYPGYATTVITDQVLQWLANRNDPETPFLLLYQHKAPHRRWFPGPEWLDLYDDVSIPEPPTLFDDYSGRASPAAEQQMEIGRDLDNRDLAFLPPDGMSEEELAAWNAAFVPDNLQYMVTEPQGDDLVRWKYQRYAKNYLRTIAAIDDNLGRVLDYLDSSGLTDNTAIIYTSDQGMFLGEHGWFDKRWMYEPSLRTPLIVRWPEVVQPGSERLELVQNLDLAQTFLDMAGVEIPAHMQGRSLLPLLRGESPGDWRQSIYYRYYESGRPHHVAQHYGVRTHTHKLIYYNQIGEWELFDLQADPLELTNVYDVPDYRDIRITLEEELQRLQMQYGDRP